MTGPKIKPVQLGVMDATRRSRKPIPGGLRAWRNEVDGLMKFINEPPKRLGKGGKNWYESMCAFYMDRLYDLINFPPLTLYNTAEYTATRNKVISLLHYHGMV